MPIVLLGVFLFSFIGGWLTALHLPVFGMLEKVEAIEQQYEELQLEHEQLKRQLDERRAGIRRLYE